MRAFALAAALFAAAAATAPMGGEATFGVDVSGTAYINAWKCLKGNGFSTAIVRAFQSTGHPDPVGPHTIYNAWGGGMTEVDVYMFPCPTCGNPSGQVQAMIDNLNKYNCNYGRIWLDIEGPQYWHSSSSENQQFFEGLLSAAKSSGKPVGIYTSQSQWDPIFGSSYEGGSSEPLWYAHYDGSTSFSDFSPFGGWSSPYMKQYSGNDELCGVGIDKDWRP